MQKKKEVELFRIFKNIVICSVLFPHFYDRKERKAMNEFRHTGNAKMIFGKGSIEGALNDIPSKTTVLIITGQHFPHSPEWTILEKQLLSTGVRYEKHVICEEPSPNVIDALTEQSDRQKVQYVLGIGGGSVLDAGKAVAAMLRHEGSVIQYLEGVGKCLPTAVSVPMIAVPTSAGTGSEATKNAVISQRGKGGFKKSLRHDAFIPHTAILDPNLALTCPPHVSLACGMDALCQLLESYISTEATPFTDALAREGLIHFGRGYRLFTDRLYGTVNEIDFREELTLAAYFSGLTLANAGLGTVHGLAGPLGAVCKVPHGVACGLLLAPVFRRLLKRLGNSSGDIYVQKKLQIATLAILGNDSKREFGIKHLLDNIEQWTRNLPRLASHGFKKDDLDLVLASSGNKNFPVKLSKKDCRDALVDIL